MTRAIEEFWENIDTVAKWSQAWATKNETVKNAANALLDECANRHESSQGIYKRISGHLFTVMEQRNLTEDELAKVLEEQLGPYLIISPEAGGTRFQ